MSLTEIECSSAMIDMMSCADTGAVRIFATLAYLGSICVTVVAALFLRHALLTLVAIFVQFCALAWYCASYIPFGRMLIRQCVGRVCCPV